MMGIYLVSLLCAVALSLIAVALGVVAYRRQPKPGSWSRIGEVFVLGLPLLVAALIAAAIAYAPGRIL
jgi:hypothetical protein